MVHACVLLCFSEKKNDTIRCECWSGWMSEVNTVIDREREWPWYVRETSHCNILVIHRNREEMGKSFSAKKLKNNFTFFFSILIFSSFMIYFGLFFCEGYEQPLTTPLLNGSSKPTLGWIRTLADTVPFKEASYHAQNGKGLKFLRIVFYCMSTPWLAYATLSCQSVIVQKYK